MVRRHKAHTLHCLKLWGIKHRAKTESRPTKTIVRLRLDATRRQGKVHKSADGEYHEERSEQVWTSPRVRISFAMVSSCCWIRYLLVYWHENLIDQLITLDRPEPPGELFDICLTQGPGARLWWEVGFELVHERIVVRTRNVEWECKGEFLRLEIQLRNIQFRQVAQWARRVFRVILIFWLAGSCLLR